VACSLQIGMVEPSKYREIDAQVRDKGCLEVLNPRVVGGGPDASSLNM
jgi:hypothetical protein